MTTARREVGAEKSQKQRARGVPGKPISPTNLPMLRTSERGTLKKCEFLWWLTYERRLKPDTEMPALRFGSLVHKALAAYYIPGVKRGLHPAKAFKKAFDADAKANSEIFGMRVEENEKWVNAEELGIAMLNNYVDEYGTDSDYEVLATEMPFKVLVYRPESYDPNYPPEAQDTAVPWFWYVGIVDGVWKHRRSKEIWVPDHKTTDGIGDKKWSHLVLDDQAGMYWSYGVDFLLLEGFLRKNHHLNGMLYNLLRKAMPDERPSKLGERGKRMYLNLDGSVSKKQPVPYFDRKIVYRDEYDRNMARERAQIDMRRLELFRSGELEISKSPGMFTCPSCGLRDACELHETGGDFEEFLAATTKQWNPYAEHEIYDGR